MTDHEHTPAHTDLQRKQALEEHEVKEVVGFLKRYGKLIGTGVIAAVLTVVAVRIYTGHKASVLAKAEELLMTARSPEQLEEVISKYSSTPTAPVALLDLAKTYFNAGDAVQARAQYQRFLKKYKAHDMRPVAELGLAYCTEADGDFNGAAVQFAQLAEKYSSSYLHPLAVLGVARCMEQAGRTEEARIVLEDFLAENAGTSWAGTAENALRALTGNAQK